MQHPSLLANVAFRFHLAILNDTYVLADSCNILTFHVLLLLPPVASLTACIDEGTARMSRLMVSFAVQGAPHRIHPETANLQTGLVL